MINQALIVSETRRGSKIAEMAKKTAIDDMEMYAVDGHREAVPFTISFAVKSVVKFNVDERVEAGHMQKGRNESSSAPR